MKTAEKRKKMYKFINLFRTGIILLFGLSGTVVVAEEKPIPNLIDNYLESFTQDFSEEFIFSAYCYGIFIDIGTELESVGKEDKDPEVRKLGEAILERADIHYEDYISQFLEEIDPNWWARAGASISTETEDSVAVKRLDDSINLIADGDTYYIVYDQMSDYEFYGLYGLCASLFASNTLFSKDISLEKLILATDNEKPMLQKVADGLSNSSEMLIDWTTKKYTEVSELDLCDLDTDFAGGALMGTAATSILAGESVVAIVTASGVLVASAPAIASGATIAAVAGSAVYLTSKGYCYWTE